MDRVRISALRRGRGNQCIHVRASRVWYHRGGLEAGEIKEIRMVLIDEQGDSIYAVVPREFVAANLHSLHEMSVYKIERFLVSDAPLVLNPVQNPMAVRFTEYTVVQSILNLGGVFSEWTYSLTPIDELSAPHDTPPRLTDVIGIIRAISYVATHDTNGRNVPTNRRHVVLADRDGHQIRINLFGEAAYRFNGQVIQFLGRSETAVVVFVGMTIHRREGTSELAGSVPCRWYINEDIPEISILRAELWDMFEPFAQLPAPNQLVLRAQDNGHYPSRPLSFLLNYDFFQNEDAMYRCDVRISALVHGQPWWSINCIECRRVSLPTPPYGYVCSDIACGCTDVTLEYRLCYLGSDGTDQARFLMVGRVARRFVGLSPRQVIINNYQGQVPVADLAAAAAQIQHPPPELNVVANTRYRLFVRAGSNNFQGNLATLHVLAVEARYPVD